jgi:hypothetical protein
VEDLEAVEVVKINQLLVMEILLEKTIPVVEGEAGVLMGLAKPAAPA